MANQSTRGSECMEHPTDRARCRCRTPDASPVPSSVRGIFGCDERAAALARGDRARRDPAATAGRHASAYHRCPHLHRTTCRPPGRLPAAEICRSDGQTGPRGVLCECRHVTCIPLSFAASPGALLHGSSGVVARAFIRPLARFRLLCLLLPHAAGDAWPATDRRANRASCTPALALSARPVRRGSPRSSRPLGSRWWWGWSRARDRCVSLSTLFGSFVAFATNGNGESIKDPAGGPGVPCRAVRARVERAAKPD